MRRSAVYAAIRLTLGVACLAAWSLVWLIALRAPDGFRAAALCSVPMGCAAAGLVFDVRAAASPVVPSQRVAVWRASASVGALIGSNFVFPPRSVPLDSLEARCFIAAALLTAVGVALDIFRAVGLHDDDV